MPWSKTNLPESVKNKSWSDAQVEKFVSVANAVLEKTGDEGEAIATGTKQAESGEHRNANQFPRAYYCRHMQPGLCGYQDEKVLVDTDALKRMIGNDAVGKPVYIYHRDVNLENLKQEAAGYITDSFYNELDGWAWFEFLAVDDEAHAAIARGWSVSNAYMPTEWGPGGTKNNVPYNREIKSGAFTHLAIVPDPRYEDACIMTPEKFRAYQESKKRQLEELRNDKSESAKGKTMFNFFKNSRQEVSTIDPEVQIDLTAEGLGAPTIAEMTQAYLNSKKNSEDEEKAKKEKEDKEKAEKANADSDYVDVEGEKVPMKELVNNWRSMKKNEMEKKNAEDEEKAKKEKEDKEGEEKKNSHFSDLQNAHHVGAGVRILETSMDKVARGKTNYGSAA